MENFNEKALIVSETPHLRSYSKTSSIMLKVFIALMPSALFGVYLFGMRALIMIIMSVFVCMASESVYNLLAKKKNTVSDMSSLVTGLLIAMNVSCDMPYGKVAIGCVFAIIIVKMLFGGLGSNFMNPALSARAFLLSSFGVNMSFWRLPFERALNVADATTGATPLANLTDSTYSLSDMFFGVTGGCIGETSSFLLILGGLYLIFAKIIKPHIPLSFIITVFIGSLFISGFDFIYSLKSIFAGGLMLGAFFMATDYVTSPVTKKGMVIAGVLCGILTLAIRNYGGYPEGVTYAILLMNAFTPLIDKVCKNKRFGEEKRWKRITE